MEQQIKPYLSALLQKGAREDGRGPFDYRNLSIETGAIARACGSARVKLGETEVLIGVKMDVSKPYPDSPDEGTLMVNAELAPLANPEFESGPPKPDAIELARVVDRGIRESGAIDFGKLCIIPKEKVWTVFIDIYPVNDNGNLFDAAAIGAIAALKSAFIPKYDEKEELVKYKELTKEKLPLRQLPVLTTFAKMNGTIFVDMTKREEDAFDARLSIATLENETVSAMQKGGIGTFTEAEIMGLYDHAVELGKKLRKHLK
ncbi:MAG: exosome complex protein Rrp42 [archaeon]